VLYDCCGDCQLFSSTLNDNLLNKGKDLNNKRNENKNIYLYMNNAKVTSAIGANNLFF